MNKEVVLLIALIIAVLCLPSPGEAEMTALTEGEMSHITGQNGIVGPPGVSTPTMALLTTGGPAGMAAILGDSAVGLYEMARIGLLPLDTPIALDVNLSGENAGPMAMQGVMLALGTASLVNPVFTGFFGLGMVPGAFDVTTGDVTVQMSGTIELSFHP